MGSSDMGTDPFIIYYKPSDRDKYRKTVRSYVTKQQHRRREHPARKCACSSPSVSNLSVRSSTYNANSASKHVHSPRRNAVAKLDHTTPLHTAPAAGRIPTPLGTSYGPLRLGSNATTSATLEGDQISEIASWPSSDTGSTSAVNAAARTMGATALEPRRGSIAPIDVRLADGAPNSYLDIETDNYSSTLFPPAEPLVEPNFAPRTELEQGAQWKPQPRATMDEMMTLFPREWADYIQGVAWAYAERHLKSRVLATCLNALSRSLKRGAQDNTEVDAMRQGAIEHLLEAIETRNEEPETIAALAVMVRLDCQLGKSRASELHLRALWEVLARTADSWPKPPVVPAAVVHEPETSDAVLL